MAERGLGTKILIGNQAISDLTGITAPQRTAETIDTTTLESEGGYRESIAGFKDSGEVTLTGFFNVASEGQKQLDEAYESGDEQQFMIVYPRRTGATQPFRGVVTAIGGTNAEVDGAIGYEATIKVNGPSPILRDPSAGLSALTITGAGGALTPAFNASNDLYAFSGVTATSVTITATAANHTIKLFVNGILTQTLGSGVASNAITIPSGKGVDILLVVQEPNKSPVLYEVVVTKS